jgi:glycosyltransferase involved in cell wall biosynthesis
MNQQKYADITLLLEGTYPFIRGGVSSWVHQIIQGLPQYTFAIIFLGSKKEDYDEQKYILPDNVVHLECHYLWDPVALAKPKACKGNAEYTRVSEQIHDWFRNPQLNFNHDVLRDFLVSFGQEKGFSAEEFYYSEASWTQICSYYEKYNSQNSFIHYLWTIKAMHAPLFTIANVAHRFSLNTGTFHTISTGFGGVLGVLLHYIWKRPLILTEHGIYTKERKIDLQSIFIKEHRDLFSDPLHMGMQYQELLWIKFFESIGRLIYQASDPIVSLYEANRKRQVDDGACPERTQVIPNGISTENFSSVRMQRTKEIPLVVGLLGRVVPIKDIKTFIRSMKIIVKHIPKAEGWLIGPEDEDKAYVEECKALVHELELDDKVKFLGFRKIHEVLPQLGILVLTSISEAFPLVILEAYASGLPVVATDVGACREIIEGNNEEDRALGSAGMVVSIADPDATARAVIAILTDENRWYQAQKSGIQRIERYYTQSRMLDSYSNIYNQALITK